MTLKLLEKHILVLLEPVISEFEPLVINELSELCKLLSLSEPLSGSTGFKFQLCHLSYVTLGKSFDLYLIFLICTMGLTVSTSLSYKE